MTTMIARMQGGWPVRRERSKGAGTSLCQLTLSWLTGIDVAET